MRSDSTAVLLDTCAVIWLAEGAHLAPAALEAIIQAGRGGGIWVSPASAWEIGMLSRPKPSRAASLEFRPDPKTWFARFMAGPGVRAAPITPDIAIEASYLPGEPHADPGDRLIIATARRLGVPIITRDRKIIAYAEQGYAQVIRC